MTEILIQSSVNQQEPIMLQQETRTAILDAAARLMERYGYKKTTMDDLAREAGIGKGTIYLYFRSKEELALSAMDDMSERLQHRLKEIALQPLSAPERLELMILERVLYRFDSVCGYSQSLDELFTALRPALLARREKQLSREALIFAEVLEDGRRAGVFTVKDAVECANALLTATNSLLPYSLSASELGAREDLQRKTRSIITLLIRGIQYPLSQQPISLAR